MGILLRSALRARAQRVANGAAASLACQEVPLCGSVERDSHSTLSAGSAGLGTEGCYAAGDPCPTFTRLLPHGLGAPRTPRTNHQVFRAPHTVKLQRQALKGCTACRFKESHLSALMQPALVLFTLSSCAGTDPCHPGRMALLSLLEAITSAFQPLGPGSSEAEGCPPPPCPASLLAIPSAAPRGPPSSPAAEPAEGASDSQPAVPARLGSLLPHLCARRGALCSPRACLPSLVPNDNKVGLG